MRMGKKQLRPKPLMVLVLSTLAVGMLFFFRAHLNLQYGSPKGENDFFKRSKYLFRSGRGRPATEGQACRVPVLDVNATEILSLMKKVPQVQCRRHQNWVEVSGSTAKISDWVKKMYGEIECAFTEVIRRTDFNHYDGTTTKTHTEYNMENTDVLKVRCASASGKRWNKVITGIRSDQEIFDRSGWSRVPRDSLKLNVLMLGLDSVSHLMWKRQLPKTYKYAVEDLKGIALNGYNIVGDGTPQALIPILTGRTELELPDTRRRMGKRAQYVNVYPFIWNDYQRNGYVTGYSEDMPQIGTFTFRLKGFQEQPTDHYMRTFYVEATPQFNNEDPYCYGDMSRFQLVLQFVRNMYKVYRDRPKFLFCFHGEYSHDNNNLVRNADAELHELLREFKKEGHLDNTLLILMSDHGSRFADIRNTQQGKQEERLPGFIFVFPPWFRDKYPDAIANFKKNADRLTTPFDIYETLKNVLHYTGTGKGSVSSRAISLFKEIPQSRTCQDASIEPHWCACLDWETVPVTSIAVVEAVKELVNFINRYTSEHRDLCLELSLGEIVWSARLVPNDYVLKYKKNSDYDGFVGDMSDKTRITVETYQVKVSLLPGNMLYEASIRYLIREKRYVVSLPSISRINRYRHMTHCIEDRNILHHLRKYCHCR